VIPATGFSYGVEYKTYPSLEDSIGLYYFSIDQHYMNNLGLTLLAGRNFPDLASDQNEKYVILNETAVKELGYAMPSEAVGQYLLDKQQNQPVEIIGVVRDFYFDLFMEKISPLALRYRPAEFRHMNIRITGNNIGGTLAFLEKKWKEMDRIHPFQYKFFDQQLARTHAIFGDVLSVISFIAFLAITISSLGLLGMAIYTTETRRKEIGIRKVLGAEINGLLYLLSRGFMVMLFIATLIAVPLAYLINHLWIQEFAYRIRLGP